MKKKSQTPDTPLIKKSRDYSGLASSVIAILVGLVFGFLVLLVANPVNALKGFKALVVGGFYNGLKSFGDVFYYAVPIILTGVGVAFAFKASIFNIGGPGQFLSGAFFGLYVAIRWDLPGALGWIVPLLASALGGAVWALVPAVLHAYRKVNIVIATIMMNYAGLYLDNYLIKKTIYDSLRNQSMPVPAAHRLPAAGLNKLFPGSVVNCGILIAIVVAIGIYLLLEKTTFGFEIKATGKNREASKNAGINARRNIMFAMLISGALCGLGGALMYLSSSGKYVQVVDVTQPEGFNGIPVALLAMNNPIGCIFSAIFLAYLQVSGFYMQGYGYTAEIVDIITSVVIYFSAFSMIISEALRRRRLQRRTGISTKKGA